MADAFWTQLLDLVGYTDFVATFADPGRPIVEISPYTYVVDGETLAANITATASQTFTTQMQGDNDFLLVYMSAFARPTGATNLTVNPAILVQIQELTTGRAFFSGPAPVPQIAGQGGFPFLMTGPKIIRARSQLELTAISAQVQTFTGFYFCYHGARIWYG